MWSKQVIALLNNTHSLYPLVYNPNETSLNSVT